MMPEPKSDALQSRPITERDRRWVSAIYVLGDLLASAVA